MALPTTVHGYTANLFTQEQCDTYKTTYVDVLQDQLNLFNNVSGTYIIPAITGLGADNGVIQASLQETPRNTVLSAGLSTLLTEWRTAHPSMTGDNGISASGTDQEKGEYKRWFDLTEDGYIASHVATLTDDLGHANICHAEMLEALISE
tara:strand:+ start:76 stop:525 length:450 start_codon:yes stop_codon:yes gene_type:complete